MSGLKKCPTIHFSAPAFMTWQLLTGGAIVSRLPFLGAVFLLSNSVGSARSNLAYFMSMKWQEGRTAAAAGIGPFLIPLAISKFAVTASRPEENVVDSNR